MDKYAKELLDKLIKITKEEKIKFKLIPNNVFEKHCFIIYVFIENHFEANLKALTMIQEKNNKTIVVRQALDTALYEIIKEENISYREYIEYYERSI